MGSSFLVRTLVGSISAKGPKGVYRSYPPTMPAAEIEKCIASLMGLTLNSEVLREIVEAFAESDRRAFLHFFHALQNASVHSLPLPMSAGPRIFVPSKGVGSEENRKSFTS